MLFLSANVTWHMARNGQGAPTSGFPIINKNKIIAVCFIIFDLVCSRRCSRRVDYLQFSRGGHWSGGCRRVVVIEIVTPAMVTGKYYKWVVRWTRLKCRCPSLAPITLACLVASSEITHKVYVCMQHNRPPPHTAPSLSCGWVSTETLIDSLVFSAFTLDFN